MNVALRKPMSVAEFLAWEERQELRHEFDGQRPVAMTGGTLGHDIVTFNIRKALDARLSGKPCRPFGPNAKIIADGSVRYPDAIVTCTKQDGRASIVSEPVIVFEVLSESTSTTDLIEKNREYRATASIMRYVIVEQSRVAALVFWRRADEWLSVVLAGEDAILALPEIDATIPLGEFYAGVDLAMAPEPAPSPSVSEPG
jgi:Uma2 family endonuclease